MLKEIVTWAVILTALSGCRVNPTTSQQSCYEYIVNRMSQVDEHYFLPVANSSITGWQLIDAATSTFRRGNIGHLTIDFYDEQALSHLVDTDSNQDTMYRKNGDTWETYNWHNGSWQLQASASAWIEKDDYRVLNYYRGKYAFPLADPASYVGEMMDYYEEDFVSHGCPLKGHRLEEYRNKPVSKTENKVKSNTIFAPWQSSLVIDVLPQITDLETMKKYDGQWYSPQTVTVLLADGSSTIWHQDNYYYVIIENPQSERSVLENFAQDFLQPCCRYRRQEGCVRKVKPETLPDLNDAEGIFVGDIRTLDELNQMTLYSKPSYDDAALLEFNYDKTETVLKSVRLNDWHDANIYLLFVQMWDEFERGDQAFIYTPEYARNYVIWTNEPLQKVLGLI